MSAVFDTLHLHGTGAIIVAAVLGLLAATFWTIKAQQMAKQMAKQRPGSGLHAYREQPASRW